MTTYKTAELEGALLDAAVAKAEWPDRKIEIQEYNAGGTFVGVMGLDEPEYFGEYHPSTDWSVGGPLIERDDIDVIRAWSYVSSEKFAAFIKGSPTESDDPEGEGPTRLIAAMRAYVASKFGETVELP